MNTNIVLFKSDIEQGNYYIHYDTKNESFIHTHNVLKEKDINNNSFFLVLIDKELKDIDVYDPDLPLEYKLRIVKECKNNPWYFFREVVRIPVVGGKERFKLTLANLALYWCFFNCINSILVIPRQTGKTTSVLALNTLLMYCLATNYDMVMLNKDDDTRKEIVDKLREIKDALPQWMILKTKKDKDNVNEIYYAALNNRYISFVAQKNILRAEAMGRGLTTPFQHWDEAAYFKYIDVSFNSAKSSMNAAIENAKKYGLPYGIIITTTAGRLDTREGSFVYGLISGSYKFNETLYDIEDRKKLKDFITYNSKTDMVYIEYSFYDLGYDDQWLQEKTKGLDQETIDKDYFNIWIPGQEKSPFDKELLKLLRENIQEPYFEQKINEYIIKWYIPEDQFKEEFIHIPVVMGADFSENIERDFSALVMVDARDLSVIATSMCNDTNNITFAMFIVELLKWYPNIVLVPERNSVGATIIDAILLKLEANDINPLKRIYNEYVQEGHPDVIQETLEKPLDALNKRLIGFRTTSKTRNQLYKLTLKKVIPKVYDKLYDRSLIQQLLNLKYRKGRIDHKEGEHDDMVIAYLLACWLLLYGKNLDVYFDHEKIEYDILTDFIDDEDEDMDPEKLELQKKFTQYTDLINQINYIEQQYEKTNDPVLKTRLGKKLLILKEQLPEDVKLYINEYNSIHEIQQEETEKEHNKIKNINYLNLFKNL